MAGRCSTIKNLQIFGAKAATQAHGFQQIGIFVGHIGFGQMPKRLMHKQPRQDWVNYHRIGSGLHRRERQGIHCPPGRPAHLVI